MPRFPPRVEYTLTEVGQSLKQVHDAMLEWGKAYKLKADESSFPHPSINHN